MVKGRQLLSALLCLLLGTASVAQTVTPADAPPAQTQPGNSQPSSPTESLISALKKSLVQQARGQAVLELVFPPSSTPLRNARTLPRLNAVPGLIRRNFTVMAAQGPVAVAGRPALAYTLTPNNEQAARWVIWVDSVWNVPLAYQERMPGGGLARRAELLSTEPKLNRLGTPLKIPASRPGLKKALSVVLPGLKLPAGFEPISVKLRALPSGQNEAEVVLSDGLNVLALVVSPRTVKAASGVVARRLGDQSVWLVGNLPQDALEGTLSGIRKLDAQALGTLTGTFAAPPASDQ
jgi:hypothetical protein